MNIPESMQADLSAWNNGLGIDLATWICCEGNYSLAVGYVTIFWPELVEYDGFIFRSGFSEESVKGFQCQEGATRKSVEWVINHVHLANVQHRECVDISADKLLVLGTTLQEIYEAKLKWQFPDKPCKVEFYIPDDPDNLDDYQVSFWQLKHETSEPE